MRREVWVCLVLALATMTVYWPVGGHGFVDYDDPTYVLENRPVRAGITHDGIVWALTTRHATNWHPLTWLSHMLDVELFGLAAGAHHGVSVALHLANAILVFLVFRGMTGAVWRSAWVAALFALHPLHVESVAWISERKDVLSTVFWMLTVWAYVAYVRQPGPRRYGLVCGALALGLMAKPMLVTLPLVLLLLDVWPLGRLSREASPRDLGVAIGRLIREKVPLFALSAASILVTLFVQHQGRAVVAVDRIPLEVRALNALVAYVSYLEKTMWPSELAVFYPYPTVLPLWKIAWGVVVLLTVTGLAVGQARRRPYLLVGWLWYVGTLVPVIGLVQVGSQAMADRYTYVPLIGVFIMLAWGAGDAIEGRPWLRSALGASAVLGLAACAVVAGAQVPHWRDTLALFEHATDVTRDNFIAHANLGKTLAEAGRLDEAVFHYRKALRIKPGFYHVRYRLARVLGRQGRADEAVRELESLLRLRPTDAEVHTGLGIALLVEGRRMAAIERFRTALSIRPDDPEAHHYLGVALSGEGRMEEALGELREAVRLNPDYAEARYNLGIALMRDGEADQAARHFAEALRIRPDYPGASARLWEALRRREDLKPRKGPPSPAD